ncbi:hypothetical protein LTR05_005857 [Lithohypha guttulata]|uniref:N-acetyltransferase domain-containing protein n=1 Tax=Lithohypha guttulata TaxID=1690604 RepID=A0AAN7YAC2_9EURO|nr:hypothetical protein LTR05_005857 [Lithohypha guttulata]
MAALEAPLRWAEPCDILRMGLVSYAGFEPTNFRAWMSPYHKQYPSDMLAFERATAQDYLADPDYLCIVIEDNPNPDEVSFTGAVIPSDDVAAVRHGKRVQDQGRVVVGLDRQHLNGAWPSVCTTPDDCPTRDQYSDHQDTAYELLINSGDEHLKDCGVILEYLVVHPAYQRRGHGQALLKWGMEIARIDQQSAGVTAADSGMMLYGAMGWVKIMTYGMAADEVSPEGFSGCVMKYYTQPEQTSGQAGGQDWQVESETNVACNQDAKEAKNDIGVQNLVDQLEEINDVALSLALTLEQTSLSEEDLAL